MSKGEGSHGVGLGGWQIKPARKVNSLGWSEPNRRSCDRVSSRVRKHRPRQPSPTRAHIQSHGRIRSLNLRAQRHKPLRLGDENMLTLRQTVEPKTPPTAGYAFIDT